MMNFKHFQIIMIGLLITLVLSFYSPDVVGQEKIRWYSMEEVQKLNQENPRKIFIDVYTDWCGWCKKMDQTTFKDTRIIELLNNQFYAVKLDGEGKEDIEFKDNVYKFVPRGRRGYHELAAVLMNGKLSYPTTVYLDENLNLIQPIPGYMTVDKLEPILIFLGEGHYKNQTWQEFLAGNYPQN